MPEQIRQLVDIDDHLLSKVQFGRNRFLRILGITIFSFATRMMMPQNPNFVVTGDASGYPEGCNPRQVATLVTQFFDAYNAGNNDQIPVYFPLLFESYSDTREGLVDNRPEMIHFSTNLGRQKDVSDYFSERYEQNEQLTLKFLNTFARQDGGGGIVDFVFVYERQADDIQPGVDGVTRVGDGLGMITCGSQKIYRWGMGMAAHFEDEEDYQWSCADHESVDAMLSATICIEYIEES